jgi:hypothetical protein
MQKTNSHPDDDVLELSLFGGGIGECIVAHVGNRSWIVVDSCMNEARDKPIAIDYLQKIGVNMAKGVKLVAVTHWDDDHIRGISDVLEQATSAKFVCSAALRTEEFYAAVLASDEVKHVAATSGISEFAAVFDVLLARSGSKHSAAPDCFAEEGVHISSDGDSGAEFYALSPSPQTIHDAQGQLAKSLELKGQIRHFPTIGPNDMSVVLFIRTKGIHFLLGGDLETGQDDRRGWRAVVSTYRHAAIISSAFKVSHHGSDDADLDDIWEKLVCPDACALLTPYARGRTPRPSAQDVARVARRTRNAYCTGLPKGVRPIRRRGVDSTINEVARTRRTVPNRPGHLRIRVPIGGTLSNAEIEMYDGARRLATL